MKTLAALLLAAVLSICAMAQEPTEQSAPAGQSGEATPADQTTPVNQNGQVPTYHVTVVSRTTKAINYRHRGGETKVDFRGTELMAQGKGSAQVEGKGGRLAVDANFEHVRPARDFGPEYLTYVLWAITPEGRASNLGELVLDNGKAHLKVTTDLQSFGMIVTAEPYFAVTRPSNLVVLENVMRSDTKGFEVPIDAKFDAVQRGQYTVSIPVTQLPATTADPKTPLELLQARNAVAMARATQADRYAPDSLSKAEKLLAQAEDYYRRKQGKTPIGTVARGATEAAEDARVLTIRRRQQEEQEARERAQQQRTQQAEEQARREQEQRQAAEQARLQAEQTRQQAEAAAEEARREQQLADQQRQQAEAARQAALAQQQAAQAEAQRAQQERDQMRQRLTQQLSQVLQTRQTAQGVIATMPDVLFDFGKYTLKPAARERLAKVAGIILAYPDLRLQIEGFTDNVGSDAYNQRLSEQRAAAVRDYLVSQGVPLSNTTAQGLGKNNPIAPNTTAQGRQLNRRVDMVVTGNAIGNNGSPVGGPAEAGAQAGGYNAGNTGGTSSPPSPANAPSQSGPGMGAAGGTSTNAPAAPPPSPPQP